MYGSRVTFITGGGLFDPIDPPPPLPPHYGLVIEMV